MPEAAPVTSAIRPLMSAMLLPQPVDLVGKTPLQIPGRLVAEVPLGRSQVGPSLAVPFRDQAGPDLVPTAGQKLLEQSRRVGDGDLAPARHVVHRLRQAGCR